LQRLDRSKLEQEIAQIYNFGKKFSYAENAKVSTTIRPTIRNIKPKVL